MDTNSSGEDLIIKIRKPYTITKQRERWTEEEHNKFLEALKLYGRAWQRIEEHIGSKTAVQIRSHAQKFFTKLEKEALLKGVPVAQALDIDIPPPRPKRKPSNPYPRKTCLETPGSELVTKDGKGSTVPFSTRKHVINLEKEPSPEKLGGDDSTGNGDVSTNENNCSEVLNLFQGTPCNTLLPSANRNFTSPTMATRNSCTFREFVSVRKAVREDGTKDTFNLEMTHASQEKLLQNEKRNEHDEPENFGALSSNDMQAAHNYPRHVPVHVLNASLGMNTQSVSLNMPSQETILNQVEEIHQGHHPNPYFSYAETTNTQHVDASSSSSLSPPYPIFDPFRSNQDNYQAYLQASSAFSGLIVSTLLQNPAAHAAASFAASFWPCANMEACTNNEKGTLGSGATFPSSSLSPPPPSMAAIAAATVAAATAWWAAHGMLPFCSTSPPPLHNGFNSNTTTDSVITNLAEKRENDLPLQNQQQLGPECSEAPQAQQQSALKLPSGQSEGAKQNAGVNAASNGKATTTSAPSDPNKAKSVKQVDRSSCGSNTPSSSEVETDALEKHALENVEEEELKEALPDDDSTHPPCDSNSRRGGRSSSITSDSWKEVSQEGRLAFRALFSREVLPQSFSPPNDMRSKGNEKINIEKESKDEEVEDALVLDLNRKMCSHQQTTENYTNPSSEKAVQWTTETDQGKLKGARHTGFKPYKRCSMEAKESLCNQGEEGGSKRIRLDGEPST